MMSASPDLGVSSLPPQHASDLEVGRSSGDSFDFGVTGAMTAARARSAAGTRAHQDSTESDVETPFETAHHAISEDEEEQHLMLERKKELMSWRATIRRHKT